jgi:hypothetical protein
MSEENKETSDLWVLLCDHGYQISTTREEIFANLDDLRDTEYDKSLCSIVLNPVGYNGEYGKECFKDMETGEITVVDRDRNYVYPRPHTIESNH